MTYVSIDLDWPSKTEITKAWYRVEKHATDGPYGRVSASGHGVHIISDKVLPDPVPVAEESRIHAGDDMDRVRADVEFPNAPNQLTFDKKDGRRADSWTDELNRLIAQYHLETNLTPTEHKIKHD